MFGECLHRFASQLDVCVRLSEFAHVLERPRIEGVSERLDRFTLNITVAILSRDTSERADGVALGSGGIGLDLPCTEGLHRFAADADIVKRPDKLDERGRRFRHLQIAQRFGGFLADSYGSIGASGTIERAQRRLNRMTCEPLGGIPPDVVALRSREALLEPGDNANRVVVE